MNDELKKAIQTIKSACTTTKSVEDRAYLAAGILYLLAEREELTKRVADLENRLNGNTVGDERWI